MTTITVNNLTYRYPTGKGPSLKDISFSAHSGELIALVGANNSGKSSLCHALAGVIPQFYQGTMEGTVVVAGMNTNDYSLGEISQKVGLVMQNPASQLSGIRYTVFDEVAFGLENRGVERSQIITGVETALSATGLLTFAKRSPYQLSGGQQQRLALASVLATEPSVLVLDEPTTFLDPQGARDLFKILLPLKKAGTTIVIAEQRLEWIAEYADTLLVLDEGKLVMTGRSAEVLASSDMQKHGIDRMPYTQAGAMALERGLVDDYRPLPVTFETATRFFRK